MPFDEINNENNENNEIIIQKGGEISTEAWVGIGVGAAVLIMILFVLWYLYNLDYLKELQEACIEMIRKELKMQMRLCLTYDLKIPKPEKLKGWKLLRQTFTKKHNYEPHKHDFSKIFILNKLEKNYFFDKLIGDWNKQVSFKEIFHDKKIQEMLKNKNVELKKETIVKYIIFDIFFCSINDVIIDEILNDFKENGLEDAKPKKDEKKDTAAAANADGTTADEETDETDEAVTLESIKQEFDNIDENKDGKISSEEFKTWMKEQGEAGTDKAGTVSDKAGTVSDKAGTVSDKAGTV
jgi:ribosomal protein L12E/L44/L45/RPP1/RPP2